MSENSDYIFYADESGDHSLTSIDASYPIFSLAICAFRKSDYCARVIPNFLRFKFRYFGHDAVVLHEREIRKQAGDFAFLTDMIVRQRFMDDLNSLVSQTKFVIFSAVIDKQALRFDMFPTNPYGLSLRVCLQSAFKFLAKRRQEEKVSHFIFEKRGPKEDDDLELEFRRIVDGENDLRKRFPGFRVHFSDKRTNSTGMQIADLTARPIGLNFIRPEQPNRAYEIIEAKLKNAHRRDHGRRGIFTPKKRRAPD